MAKRIYIGEAVGAKPIVSRLMDNVSAAAEALSSMVVPESETTVKQVRQQIDHLAEELAKFRSRLLKTEESLQGEFERAKRKNRK